MVRTSKEVTEFYTDWEKYTFFDKNEAMKAVFVPLKYVKNVEQFISELSQKENNGNNEKSSMFAKFRKTSDTVSNMS